MRLRIAPVIIVAVWAVSAFPALAASPTPSLKAGWQDLSESSLTAHGAIVVDIASGKTLYQKNQDGIWPAASLTKVMTSVIWLEQKPTMSRRVTITDADEVGGGRLRVATGTVVTQKDLFYCALVGSANNTAMAMMRASGLSSATFVDQMNVRAVTLGMSGTRYHEPSGMDPRNTVTARDMARLITYAFANPTIRKAVQTGYYRFSTIAPRIDKTVKSTNALLLDSTNDLWITGGKTGYLDEAQNNLAVTVKTMRKDKELAVVVLGAATKRGSFDEAERLAKWAWQNYEWKR